MINKFEVQLDQTRNLLRWTLRDFWTIEDVTAFAAEMRKTMAILGPPPHTCDGLCDAIDFPVQSAEVGAALGRINDVGRTMRKGRTAIIVGSVMNKLQAERTLMGDDVRVFLAPHEATAWLDAG